MTNGSEKRLRGPIAWMTGNSVTANLLMLLLLIGGLVMTTRIKQEVFPEFSLDMVTVQVSYPGASPEEVEQGIILAVEESLLGLEGIDELSSTAVEGSATIRAELEEGSDQQKIYQEIQQGVDRITTFPDDAEQPQVSLVSHRREVLNLSFYGQVPEATLREVAEQARDRLLQDSGITQIDVLGGRDYEIQIEISQQTLRTYDLTLQQVADTISRAAIEMPGGELDTAAGKILLRVKERRDWASEFAQLPIITTADGTVLTLEQLAEVREGFEESDRAASYNGQPSISLSVYRVGEQTPIGVSERVRELMQTIEADLPPGIDWSIGRDNSEVFQQRLDLLLKNAFLGLALVLVVLGLFLEFKLAFWVTMGIPTSFLGAMLFLPLVDVSINMISMFAFIVALGIVVDDAIVAGENIYEYRQRGHGFFKAAVLGARDVAVPITFAILSNVVAFLPLAFVPGTMGKVWQVIPMVVISVFAISWIESLLILPAHLAHTRSAPRNRITAALHRRQQAFSRWFSYAVERYYRPFLELCLRFRWITVATGLMVLILVVGYVASGRIGIIMMPKVESDRAVVTATLPYGSPLDRIEAMQAELESALQRVAAEHGGAQLLDGTFSLIDQNEVEVTAYLTDPKIRPLGTGEVTKLWRQQVGELTGLESLLFESDRGGPGGGAGLTVELSHRDIATLDLASSSLAASLSDFPNLKDISDGYIPGKQQLDFRMTAAGRSLGLSANEVARQVRNAFYGSEALRQQRGRHEVSVMVRLPEDERQSELAIEELMVRTPAGVYVPLRDVAEVERGRAYTSIDRRNGRRTVTVTANVEPIGETQRIQAELERTVLPQLVKSYPGLSYSYQGKQADMSESMGKLLSGFGIALLITYLLLAIPFRSYIQPLIVMIAIPFGIVGAVLGHVLMGYNLSVVSMMGIIALSGVVVNDSLVLIDYANRQRLQGISAPQAISLAGVRRFRPILLTTLTTFGGLAPMIFETSRQARFLIPMALSLGYGILFATLIALILVPALYLIMEDIRQLFSQQSAVSENDQTKRMLSPHFQSAE